MKHQAKAFTLLEILAVVAILGVVAALALSRFTDSFSAAQVNSCHVNKGEIELQVQRWYRTKQAAPAANLATIGADANYFPAGLPTCPVDGTAYTINTTTLRVVGHTH